MLFEYIWTSSSSFFFSSLHNFCCYSYFSVSFSCHGFYFSFIIISFFFFIDSNKQLTLIAWNHVLKDSLNAYLHQIYLLSNAIMIIFYPSFADGKLCMGDDMIKGSAVQSHPFFFLLLQYWKKKKTSLEVSPFFKINFLFSWIGFFPSTWALVCLFDPNDKCNSILYWIMNFIKKKHQIWLTEWVQIQMHNWYPVMNFLLNKKKTI